jgi:hypothetical protein
MPHSTIRLIPRASKRAAWTPLSTVALVLSFANGVDAADAVLHVKNDVGQAVTFAIRSEHGTRGWAKKNLLKGQIADIVLKSEDRFMFQLTVDRHVYASAKTSLKKYLVKNPNYVLTLSEWFAAPEGEAPQRAFGASFGDAENNDFAPQIELQSARGAQAPQQLGGRILRRIRGR